MKNISAIILAKNEERKIKKAIHSVSFCDEVIVIDDHSTDNTGNLSRAAHASVIKKGLKNNFAQQRNEAMMEAKNDWILFLDADELITEELKNEIKDLPQNTPYSSYQMKRTDFFWNKQLRFGETGTAIATRLVNRKRGKFVRSVHEVWQTRGANGRLSCNLLHYPHQTIAEFLQEINNYSTINAREFIKNNRGTSLFDIMFTPLAKFVYTYFFKLGFLDGPAGFVYSFMMSFHSFLTRSKLYLLQH